MLSPELMEKCEKERRECKMLRSGMPRVCNTVERTDLINEVAQRLRDNAHRGWSRNMGRFLEKDEMKYFKSFFRK